MLLKSEFWMKEILYGLNVNADIIGKQIVIEGDILFMIKK